MRFPLFLEQAASDGGGPARPAVPPANPQQRASSLADRLIARHGTAEAALSFLATQNITLEDTIDGLRRENGDLKGRVPGEGAMVLDKAAAANWTKLQDLKLTPDQLVAAVGERDTLKTERAAADRRKAYRDAAPAAGLDPDAFEAIGMREELTVEMRGVDVTEHGKTVKRQMPFIKTKGDKATFQSASDYLASLPAHDQRALKPSGAPVPPTGAVTYVRQSPAPSNDKVADPVTAFAQRRNQTDAAKPHPLLPQARPAAAATS